MRLLNSIRKEDFLQSFQDMYSRSQWCIVIGGNYFEKDSKTGVVTRRLIPSDLHSWYPLKRLPLIPQQRRLRLEGRG
ncbi:hypothetical protein TNCV_279181 [Trichonephila clavipes]|nr:hypothetical protein TNCV_279181 [Trichonephila clavipes]